MPTILDPNYTKFFMTNQTWVNEVIGANLVPLAPATTITRDNLVHSFETSFGQSDSFMLHKGDIVEFIRWAGPTDFDVLMVTSKYPDDKQPEKLPLSELNMIFAEFHMKMIDSLKYDPMDERARKLRTEAREVIDAKLGTWVDVSK